MKNKQHERLLNMLLDILHRGEGVWFTKDNTGHAMTIWKTRPWLETMAYLRWRGK